VTATCLLVLQLLALHKARSGAISHCVDSNTAEVHGMKDKMATLSESDPEYQSIKKKLGMQLRKVTWGHVNYKDPGLFHEHLET